jgi:DNA-binding NarL/FixJ family response regulator
VLLVDDQPPPREALRFRLAKMSRFQVVGEADDPDEALGQISATRPDVAVIDISFGKLLCDVSGLVLTREVCKQSPRTRVLIWTMHDSRDYLDQAKHAGAHGYVLKTSPMEEIVRAIEVVADGARYCSASVEQAAGPQFALTAREREVLKLVVRAKSSKEIAKDLKIDRRTVETHRRNIMDKLEVKKVVQLVTIAYSLGLVDFMA